MTEISLTWLEIHAYSLGRGGGGGIGLLHKVKRNTQRLLTVYKFDKLSHRFRHQNKMSNNNLLHEI